MTDIDVKNTYNTLQENTDKLRNQNVRKQPNGNNHNKNQIQFHPRVENLTNIGFNNNVLELLSKGLQRNLMITRNNGLNSLLSILRQRLQKCRYKNKMATGIWRNTTYRK
jgi:hypothetical protein